MKTRNIYHQTEKIGNCLSLSQDVCSNASLITVTGTMKVLIENYRGLLEYTSDRIVLDGIRTRITITGNKLTIQNFNNEDCMIQGTIDSISFDKTEEDS